MGKILEQIGTVEVPAIPEFRVRDHFVENRLISNGFRIGYINCSVRRLFLDNGDMVEESIPAIVLRAHRLLQPDSNVHSRIVAQLGEAVVETTLGQVYELMKAQSHRGRKYLHISDSYNCFYVRDREGTLQLVQCFLWNRSWGVTVQDIAHPGLQSIEYHVFTH